MKALKTILVKDSSVLEYDVILTNKIFDIENKTIKNYCYGKKILVVLSETVNKLYSKYVIEYFEYNFKQQYKIIVIPTTEYNKNIESVSNICKAGKEFCLDRNSLMVAIGGGILLDMVGFSASMYKRRMDYIKIPTTLLGQIDAGIGIKTGVNFEDSKNFLGSYHPPIATINDIKLLETLQKKEVLFGLAEIIKMAIVKDSILFELIESNSQSLIKYNFQEKNDIPHKINERSILRMLEELTGNFLEHNLERLVDFGHTFSPFIEGFTNYKVSHGAAVALDIAISTELNYIKNGISKIDRDRILNLILDIGLQIYDEKTFIPDLMWESLQNILLHRGMNLNLVVPINIGEATFIKNIKEISPQLLNQTFTSLNKIQSLFYEKEVVMV
ncbi:sedoheptulose 7-phosphate cyclase [Sporosarcina sp. FSL K6-1508]|uniref:sedoheptulose 7-phosphate cyclase n=1 Tax=Sporosarcina sp. FSL K6-1508 TaxID=2921553 RepID=UPI0030F55835